MKQTFFLQIPPGFEIIAQKELEHLFQRAQMPLPEMKAEKGGLEFQYNIEEFLDLIAYLKIPNRVLLRLTSFKVRDVPKLFNKIKKFNWSPYLAGQEFDLKISTHKSRLFDERKINKAIKDGVKQYFLAQEPAKKSQDKVKAHKDWTLHCRIEDDLCQISLDLSGQRLGKRGYKEQSGMAPLRENLAAGLLWEIYLSLKQDQKASLYDPFAGSGTLLLEAHELFKKNTYRQFSYQFLPKISFKKIELENFKGPFEALLGTEKDLGQFNRFKENINHLKAAISPYHCAYEDFDPKIQDLFIVTNPPYGLRVKGKGSTFLNGLITNIKPIYLGFLWPLENPKLTIPKGYKSLKSLNFSHGGLPLRYHQLSRNLYS